MFKPGDKVVCISTGPSRYLVVGGEYTVKSLTDRGEFLTVEEIDFPHTHIFPADLS